MEDIFTLHTYSFQFYDVFRIIHCVICNTASVIFNIRKGYWIFPKVICNTIKGHYNFNKGVNNIDTGYLPFNKVIYNIYKGFIIFNKGINNISKVYFTFYKGVFIIASGRVNLLNIHHHYSRLLVKTKTQKVRIWAFMHHVLFRHAYPDYSRKESEVHI